MIQRRKLIISAVGAAATAVVAGCSSPAKKGGGAATWVGTAEIEQPVVPVQLTVTPADATAEVSPVTPIVVSAANGKLESVTVTSGKVKIDGETQDDGTWRSAGDLAYGKKYTVTVTAADSAGTTSTETSTFTTLKPENTATVAFQANAMLALEDGETYGAGQPVIVRFSRAVNKAGRTPRPASGSAGN